MNEHKNPFSNFKGSDYTCVWSNHLAFCISLTKGKKIPLCSYLLIVNCVTLVGVQGMVIFIQILNPSAVVCKHFELQGK